MATRTVTIKGTREEDIEYSPTDKIQPNDTVTFTLQNLEAFTVTISWDSGCPVTDSSNVGLNGNNLNPSANRTVSDTAADGQYAFTVTFQSIVPPGTEEEPEEPGPTHGGLEVSREN
ncbi:MAG TPA: hypothetical protein VF815_14770 [Myxococcaceae bacterium]